MGTVSQASARILVVEDEHLVAMDIEQSLQQFGHSVFVTYCAEDAIRTAHEQQVEIAVMDIRLKGTLDGIDAAAAIRQQRDVAIIYLTAYADDATLERARRTEPYGYVLKPFQERELKAIIDMTLERRRREIHQAHEAELQDFLAGAVTQMTATLDPYEVARSAVSLLVPRYADFCVLHVAERSDVLPQILVTAPRVLQLPRLADAGALLDRVRLEETAELISDIGSGDSLRQLFGDSYIIALAAVKSGSLLCVPLEARGQSIGALAVVAGEKRPPISYGEIAFVSELAHRVATALDNALLYGATRDASRMRDDILAIVSHGLRTPLGIIMLEAGSITEDPSARPCRHVDRIQRATQRMHRMVGDMLDASTLDGHALQLDCKMCSVAPLVEEALEMFRSEAEDQSIDLRSEVSDPSAKLSCDHDRIVQVLSGLIANAFKVTPPAGSVTLSADRVKDGIRFGVRETSRGNVIQDGLALTIARRILQAHSTSLVLESDPDGSQFHFVLAA